MLKRFSHRFLSKLSYFLAITFPVVFFLENAQAQTLIVDNDSKVSADISTTELTRISVVGDRIQLVRGAEGAYRISNDTVQGAVFIKPLIHTRIQSTSLRDQRPKIKAPPNSHQKQAKPGKQKKTQEQKNDGYQSRDQTDVIPFDLFISTEQGRHYVLHLIPTLDRQADLLVLKPQELVSKAAKAWETRDHYALTLVRLVNAILEGKPPSGYVQTIFQKPPQTFSLRKVIHGILTQHYQGGHLQVDVYQLTNHSRIFQRLTEADFYQPGDRAIYLQAITVAPHQTITLMKVTSHVSI